MARPINRSNSAGGTPNTVATTRAGKASGELGHEFAPPARRKAVDQLTRGLAHDRHQRLHRAATEGAATSARCRVCASPSRLSRSSRIQSANGPLDTPIPPACSTDPGAACGRAAARRTRRGAVQQFPAGRARTSSTRGRPAPAGSRGGSPGRAGRGTRRRRQSPWSSARPTPARRWARGRAGGRRASISDGRPRNSIAVVVHSDVPSRSCG